MTPNNAETITNFNAAKDIIDLSALAFFNNSSISIGAGTISAGNISADSIGWMHNGNATTTIYVDLTNHSEALTSADVEIVLNGNISVSTTNFSYPGHLEPAGVAGSPINLGLTNPSRDGALVSVTVSGVPANWSLSQGVNNGNGTWTVETTDPATLTVTTPASLVGATVLNVTENWINADGSSGFSVISDNVEFADAPGSPIFALSGDDHLTGLGTNDLFVFANPIGNDIVYNFDVLSDKIDLIGFSNITSFGELHIANDAGGDAVITLGGDQTIALYGVNAGSLTATDFVFDQSAIINNSAIMAVTNGAVLPLEGTVDNTGAIALNAADQQTELQIVGDGLTLEGGGQLTMSDSSANSIVGATPATTLTNVDNTISGAGQIGGGDGDLTLVNEAHGTIDADAAGGILTIDTGNAIVNAGLLEATNGGTLLIDDAVSGGSAVIAGGILDFAAAASVNVTFDNGTGVPAYGELVLGDATDFSGQIAGFSGTAPDASHSDVVDLSGFAFTATTFAEAVSNGNLVLTATDGSEVVTLTFDNFDGTLDFASNGNGGTLIYDPPASDTVTGPVVASTATGDSVSGAISLADANADDTFTDSVRPDGSNYAGSFSLDQPVDDNGHVVGRLRLHGQHRPDQSGARARP